MRIMGNCPEAKSKAALVTMRRFFLQPADGKR
jgi:hypothetical protein